MYLTVLVPAVNVPAVLVVVPPIFSVLELPRSAPLVLVQAPVKVCVKPAPRFRVPPEPLNVKAPPLTLPVNVAVPAVLVMDTVPVVVKLPMLCVAVPAIVTPPEPLVVPPLLIRLPFKVNK